MLQNVSRIGIRHRVLRGLFSHILPVRTRTTSIPQCINIFYSAATTPSLCIRCYHATTRAISDSIDDTIYAVSTAAGRAGIAIIRVSGPSCLEIYTKLCPSKAKPKPRYACVRTLFDTTDQSEILDTEALVIYFPSPKTVTGEDILELHIHGGSATVKGVLAAIQKCATTLPVRYAEPGEFTRRAFQNDRLDLAQVEALGDTLAAETEQQRRAAVRGSSGNLGRTYETWRQQLLYARGELEALIDFSEDQHFDESPAELMFSVIVQVQTMLNLIRAHEMASHRGELLKKGIRISLLGPPNAGKSSLLNRIVGREASIVSHEAGTTRDIVEVSLDIRGYLCTFADTAGLRTQADGRQASQTPLIGAIEEEGIRRAKAKAHESDLIIALASVEESAVGWTIHFDTETLELAGRAAQSIIVVNKRDSVPADTLSELLAHFKSMDAVRDVPLVAISCEEARSASGADPGNLNYFIDQLVVAFKAMTDLPPDIEDLLGVTERQRQLLSSCSDHLNLFIGEASVGQGEESDIVLAAEHLRSAANCLSRITGRGEAGDVEEVLGVVFEK